MSTTASAHGTMIANLNTVSADEDLTELVTRDRFRGAACHSSWRYRVVNQSNGDDVSALTRRFFFAIYARTSHRSAEHTRASPDQKQEDYLLLLPLPLRPCPTDYIRNLICVCESRSEEPRLHAKCW